ncbi:hypothetical protein [Mucilaginibacter phyllosphaerae]|uniref:Uncharacterized protein n=1 Tax=Mucilaginibacter phyllosphaerae TaxID=1812349 RepID=A0A4Y8A7G7_9SPHI|nr:hypothetical protein [Mucilaginibacter phyllosphaerae]MBB3971028.1 hypothetical protein [Mucilaginibacter phyllosphaerae]TEW63771.1 hypothetical protein E2R65_18550 [Mucilaginibacter phyllosphaerae]GGH22044.1 hypothetical protein GCM10007352_35120 [Mucilaginibacter phyllosphaerae]
MKPSEKAAKIAANILSLGGKYVDYISRLKMEVFKDSYQFYFVLPQSILTVVVKESIVAELNNKMHQHTLDFYNNEVAFENIDEFEKYFNNIIRPIREWAEGIIAIYNGDKYLCEVEVSSIDTDRQMGVEVLYDIKFYDPESEEDIVAAEVSEYPNGIFSIYDKHGEVETEDEKILAYFYKHQQDNDSPDDEDAHEIDPSDIDLDF